MAKKKKAALPKQTKEVLPMDQESFRTATRFYANYVHLTIKSPLDATLIFCQRTHEVVAGGKPADVAYPQAVCFMSIPHFLTFAKMVSRQAKRLEKAMSEAEAEHGRNN